MTNNQNAYNPQSVPTGNDPNCAMGRRAIHVTIDFSLGTTFNLDIQQVQALGQFDAAQTLYIDNSGNANVLTVLLGLTLQTIKIPANAQAYIPILQPNPPVFKISTTGAPIVDVQILNFFVPPIIWYPNGITVVDATLAAVISNGGVNVNTRANVITGPVDHSGTIAAANTPQSLVAADATRKRLLISNPSNAVAPLSITFAVNTNGYSDIAPGQTWDEANTQVSGDQVFIKSATLAAAFTCLTW